MTAPLLDGQTSTVVTALSALAIGIAFGWTLERAGLGNARKLVGQFHLTDLTVFKVMFSALVTALLGVFWLGRLGWLDVGRLYLPETFLVPQLTGGLIFGVGFALSGLCPGTSCVAAASGRLDGLAAVAGIMAGVWTIGWFIQPLSRFYESTSRGAVTLPEVTGIPSGVIVLAVVSLALAGFRVAEWIEARRT